MVINKNLTDHTTAERLWLTRRVLKLTQKEMADKLNLTRKTYYRIENGNAVWRDKKVLGICWNNGHLCALARRRTGKTLAQAAKGFGISHATLNAQERRCDPGLVKRWENLGYLF